jgi:hypothetical protein
VNTPIRRLEGIAYWVIEDADAIYDFINTEARKEWEEDARSEHRDPKDDLWLKALSKRKWSLTITETERIGLNPDTVNFVDRESGYNFREHLEQRRSELQKSIQSFGVVIWPLIVRGEDMQLVDGYCRLATLKTMNVSRVYVYVGALCHPHLKTPSLGDLHRRRVLCL